MQDQQADTYAFTRSFTQTDFDRFADLSGDNNPIHVDQQFAARTKFGYTVAHGMLLFSVLCGGLSEGFPDKHLVLAELMFPSPTYTGEKVTIQLIDHGLNSDTNLQKIELKIIRPNGVPGCLGFAQLSGYGKPIVLPRSVNKSEISQVNSYKTLHLGQRASTTHTYSTSDLIEYCQLSGDVNPIFSDPGYAHRLGFLDTPIPVGLLGGLVSYLLGVKLPGRGTNWLKQRYTFLKPAYPGQQIKASVEITRLRPQKELVNLVSYCTGPDGIVLCSGESLVLVNDLE